MRSSFVTGRSLDSLLREAERSGIDTSQVLTSLGYERLSDQQNRRDASIDLADYFRIEGEVARQLDDLTAHLSERKLTYETGAFVTSQMSRSTTLSDALTHLAQYFNMMHGEHYNSVRTTDRTVSLIINDASFPYTMRDDPEMVYFIGECVLIKVQCLLDSLSGGLAAQALRRVVVKRPQGQSDISHLEFWHVPVSFGQTSYELCFDSELAQVQMRSPNEIDLSSEGVFSRVVAYLNQLDPSQANLTYRTKVMDLIRNGVFQQETVAHRLSMSVATLRRRLEREGTSFRSLMSEHLVDEATKLLRKGHSVSHVSEVLNYSDVRAFNRAFKRWKGETPAQYARKAAQVPDRA